MNMEGAEKRVDARHTRAQFEYVPSRALADLRKRAGSFPFVRRNGVQNRSRTMHVLLEGSRS